MMFRTQYDPHFRFLQPTGNRVHNLRQGRFDDSGIFVLDIAGSEDIYDMIQSHAASVDIHVILDRFRRGDINVLGDASRSVYCDISEMPRDYAQLLNFVIDGERAFMSLPVDERAKFDHSFAKWLMSFDNVSKNSDTSEPSKNLDKSEPVVNTNE